jgi:hypothetical protein
VSALLAHLSSGGGGKEAAARLETPGPPGDEYRAGKGGAQGARAVAGLRGVRVAPEAPPAPRGQAGGAGVPETVSRARLEAALATARTEGVLRPKTSPETSTHRAQRLRPKTGPSVCAQRPGPASALASRTMRCTDVVRCGAAAPVHRAQRSGYSRDMGRGNSRAIRGGGGQWRRAREGGVGRVQGPRLTVRPRLTAGFRRAWHPLVGGQSPARSRGKGSKGPVRNQRVGSGLGFRR